jgi:hypothetical protein
MAEELGDAAAKLNLSVQETFIKHMRSGMKLDEMLQDEGELVIKVGGRVAWKGYLEKYGRNIDDIIEVLHSWSETKE